MHPRLGRRAHDLRHAPVHRLVRRSGTDHAAHDELADLIEVDGGEAVTGAIPGLDLLGQCLALMLLIGHRSQSRGSCGAQGADGQSQEEH